MSLILLQPLHQLLLLRTKLLFQGVLLKKPIKKLPLEKLEPHLLLLKKNWVSTKTFKVKQKQSSRKPKMERKKQFKMPRTY